MDPSVRKPRQAKKRRRRACPTLPPDILADIHGRLNNIVDRLVFTAVFGAPRDALKPSSAPWLVLPGETTETAALFSLADRRAGAVRAPDPALRGPVVLGSGNGWIVTADERAQMHLVNPVTGRQRALPAITTMGSLLTSGEDHGFAIDLKRFFLTRFPGSTYWGSRTSKLTAGADWMGRCFYRKVVLSADSALPGSFAAMLILGEFFGAPAFATAEDASWRLAPSPYGVEDAVHHRGRFYSISGAGVVHAWTRGAGGFTATEVTSSLENSLRGRKYLAAAPDGRRLMAVCKVFSQQRRFFEVQILHEASGRWEEASAIGEAAVFVGVNGSLCVSTKEQPALETGCVYFTDDELSTGDDCHLCNDDVGVYNIREGTLKKIEALGKHRSWPPPAWFTRSDK